MAEAARLARELGTAGENLRALRTKAVAALALADLEPDRSWNITGRSGLHRLIDWLFRITGQRDGAFSVDDAASWPHSDLWEPFRQRFVAAGFRLRIEQVRLPRSVAKRLLLTGDCLSGREAADWGLAIESAPADDLQASALPAR